MNTTFIKTILFIIVSVFFGGFICSQNLSVQISSTENQICNGHGCDYSGPSILINEVMLRPVPGDGSIYGIGAGFTAADNEGEWIELYNPDKCNAVDISCYFLGNNTNDRADLSLPAADHAGGFILPQGTIVPPQGFCIVRGPKAPPVPSNLLVQNGVDEIKP
jgi:hypothetical protein